MTDRRKLQYSTVEEVIGDVECLRAGYAQQGDWSLPQIAYHLNAGLASSLHEPDVLEPTPEQQKVRPFLMDVAAHGWPDKKLESPDFMRPPPNAPISLVDEFLMSLRKLAAYKAAYVGTKPFGAVDTETMRRFFLAHAAHHLSFMSPTVAAMTRRQDVRFATIDAVIEDVQQLRAGYVKTKSWTLPQICGHLAGVVDFSLVPAPPDALSTPEQTTGLNKFVEMVMSGNSGAMTAPPSSIPSADSGNEQIEHFIASLQKLKSFPHDRLVVGKLGAAPIETVRGLHLMHSAHHLSYLIPTKTVARPGLSFADIDAVIADVKPLRAGCRKTGNWSFAQACFHLDQAVQTRMKPEPFPPQTEAQTAARPTLDKVLASGTIPKGLEAPPALMPPPTCDDAAIDALLATLERFNRFTGPIAPQRFFGHMNDADARRLNLIHIAHHLRHFAPN